MLFSTPLFLFFYFPVVTLVYFLMPRAAKNAWLLSASFLFFFWGAPTFSLMMLASSVLDWLLGKRIARGGHARKGFLLLSLANNLGILFYFKYANFFVDNVNAVFAALGMEPFVFAKIALPIGVSFLAFEKITYTVDIYRGDTAPSESLVDYLAYVFLFPKVLAGPIMKYRDIAGQMKRREVTLDKIYSGTLRFALGLSKKVLLADVLAEYVEASYALPAGTIGTADAWTALFAFTLQIYMDFSAYSDMAIGIAEIYGFRLMENFNRPYMAENFTDHWRRWHISLSTWIRDYVYIPLGGSRTGHTYRNLILSFLASGLWHGANWTFVAWSMCHCIFIILDRLFWLNAQKALPKAFNISLTFFLIMVIFSIFRAPTIDYATQYLNCMTAWHPVSSGNGNFILMGSHVKAALAVAALVSFYPMPGAVSGAVRKSGILRFLIISAKLLIFSVACAKMVTATFHPFLYFRF